MLLGSLWQQRFLDMRRHAFWSSDTQPEGNAAEPAFLQTGSNRCFLANAAQRVEWISRAGARVEAQFDIFSPRA